MKKVCLIAASALLSLTLASAARAGTATGFVLCDANQNGVIDSGDVPIPGVTVIFRQQFGTLSNSTVTAADGSFSFSVPPFDPLLERIDPLAQLYIENLDPTTLPAGSTILIPGAITNLSPVPTYYIAYAADLTNLVYTSAAGNGTTGNWLIDSPECQAAGNCKLTGGGNISGGKKPNHSFGGTILSGTPPSGSWTDVAHVAKLKFETTAIQTVSCSDGTIDFTGTGTLQGIAGNKARFNSVLFTAHIEDRGSPGKKVDTYYLRVYTADGTTLLLVSGNPGDPTDISPVPITHGNLSVVPQ